ncbi:MAG: DUF4292 domain-containing protein [Rubricoccaceae bacterium]|nr:DUF4292 domain-containing protein [Rubricoccaceae bacterium]
MIPSRRLLVLGLLSAAAWAAGCSGPLVRNAPDADAPADFPNHTADQVVYRLAQAAGAVAAFSSEARVGFETPEGGQGVSASLRARLADSVYATLRGPLSITVGRGLVTADSFFAHDLLGERFYLGPLAVADAYVPGAGAPGALGHTLLGLLAPRDGVPWEILADSSAYVLTGPMGDDRYQRYVVDPSVWRVTAFEEYGPGGDLLSRRTFSAFDVVDGIVLPRRVLLESPRDGLAVTVEHRRLALDPDDLDLAFRRPSEAETIRLE